MRLVRSTPYGVSLTVAITLLVGSLLAPPLPAHGVTLPSVSVHEVRHDFGATFVNNSLDRPASEAARRHTVQSIHRVIKHAPVVLDEPRSSTVRVGHAVIFTARSSATPRARVTWLVERPHSHRYGLIRGASTNVLRVSKVSLSQNGSRFEAVFTNALGHAHTTPAVLRVLRVAQPQGSPTPAPSPASSVAPVVTLSPQDESVSPGASATFFASASGAPAPSIQWEVSSDSGVIFVPLVGATSSTLSLLNVTTAMNAQEYEAVFTNSAGTATSTVATLRVTSPSIVPVSQGSPTPAPSPASSVAPVVTLSPQDESVSPGASATFFASASGAPAPSIQWEVSSDSGVIFVPLVGATSSTLSLLNVTTAMNAQEYEAVFTNSAGTATSTVATLRVTSLTPNLQPSSNWAGYVATPGTFTSVSATWTVPTATCTSVSTYSSVWVGIDGYQSPSVEQDGTEADCVNGAAQYSAWYEMYGNTDPQCNCYSSVTVNHLVVPGDVVTGTVQEISGTWTMTLSDATQQWTFSTTATSPTPVPAQSSAEWIFERPNLCSTSSCTSTTLTTLTTQSPVVFTNAAATTTTSSSSGPISAFPYVALQMVDSSTLLATPSTLDPSGGSFSIHE